MGLLKCMTVSPTDLLNFPRSQQLFITTTTTTTTTAPSNPISHSPIRSFNSSPSPKPSIRFFLENPQNFIELLKNSSKNSINFSGIELLHSRAIKSGFALFGQVGIGLLTLYVKQSYLDHARRLFDEIPQRDTLAWTTLISGYARIGNHDMGLNLFYQMVYEGTLPNHFTLSSVLRCCTSINDLETGKEIHGWVLRNGVGLDVVLHNSIIDLYAKCGAFRYAKRIFETMNVKDTVSWNLMIDAHLQTGDTYGSVELFKVSPLRDVASWNTLISGLMHNGFDAMALQLLHEMVETGLTFNQFTVSTTLVLASKLAFLDLGIQIHSQALKNGFENDAFIKNSLIYMYCKCGKMEDSLAIFNTIFEFTGRSERSEICYNRSMSETISWSSMVAGYVQNGRSEEALELFRRMLREGLKIDRFSITSITAACSDAGILEQGRQIHACIEKLGHGFDSFLASAITDMYAKCGSLEDARTTFDRTEVRSSVLWTSIISSYALHGQGKEALWLFERMLEVKIKPNEISYVGVLSACSHGGLVREGQEHFKSMQEDHGLIPGIEHYTCMVDLLGRAGLLNEARDFIIENNLNHHNTVWQALLSACRVHNNVEMAMWASEQLVRLEPLEAGSYVLLSNIYSTKMRWSEASELRSSMLDREVRKQPGLSWIQLKDKVHTFVAGDQSHPQINEICSYLESLVCRSKEMGYSIRTEFVVHDVEEEQREASLSFHSEKLAIAYGIINTPCRLPLRAMKNLRVCKLS